METKRKTRGAGRPPVKDQHEHREAVLEAATEVFLERGFAKASTAEIARRAGASKGTLYSLYSTKAELYAALLQRRVGSALGSLLQQPLPEDAPMRETLIALGVGIHRWVSSAEAQRLYRLVVAEAGDFPELGAALWENGPAKGKAVLKSYLDKKVEQGLLEIEDTDRTALQFLGMLIGVVVMRGSLRLPPIDGARDAAARWVAGAVDDFLRAHRTEEGSGADAVNAGKRRLR